MKSEAFLNYAHGHLSAFGFILFILVFVAVTIRVFYFQKKAEHDRIAHIVFEDGSRHERN